MEAITGDEDRDENSQELLEGETAEGDEKNEIEEMTFVGDDESQFFNQNKTLHEYDETTQVS